MAGCVEDRELDVAHLERITLVHRVAVLEVELTAMVNFSAGAPGQFEGADDVVLVAMRLEDVGDLRPPRLWAISRYSLTSRRGSMTDAWPASPKMYDKCANPGV